MENFGIKKQIERIVPTWKDVLSVFILCHLPFFTVYLHWFLNNIILAEFIFIMLCFAFLSRKKARYVYLVSFDDEKSICTIFYYQYQFIKLKRSVCYEDIDFQYIHIVFYKGQVPLTLRIMNRKRMVVDIREKYNIGYTNDEIFNIKSKLEQIKKKYDDSKM